MAQRQEYSVALESWLSTIECSHRMDVCDRYALSFVPALRFVRSQILCRFYKSPSGERSPVCMRISAKRSHDTHVKDPVVHGRVWWIMEINTKMTQYAQKVSEPPEC